MALETSSAQDIPVRPVIELAAQDAAAEGLANAFFRAADATAPNARLGDGTFDVI
jgi:hypothetical protein